MRQLNTNRSTAADEQAPRLPRSIRWQFSLRELVLLTTAGAAILSLAALYLRRSARFEPSSLQQRLVAGDWIGATCKKLGQPAPVPIGEVVQMSEFDGCQWRREYSIAIAPGQRGAFMDALHLELFAMQKACAIDKYMARGKKGAQGWVEFHHGYQKQATAGSVWVTSTDTAQSLRLSVLVQEHAMHR